MKKRRENENEGKEKTRRKEKNKKEKQEGSWVWGAVLHSAAAWQVGYSSLHKTTQRRKEKK